MKDLHLVGGEGLAQRQRHATAGAQQGLLDGAAGLDGMGATHGLAYGWAPRIIVIRVEKGSGQG